MFHVIPRDAVIPTLELVDDDAGSVAVLAPARGGLLTRFAVAGRELLYMDRATFDDPARNVHGGNPVLFPAPGKTEGDAWARGGVRGAMKQHGFARTLPWEVAATGTTLGASATLRLRASDATRAEYPWDFTLEYSYLLRGATLRIDVRITNESKDATPMPFAAGFHPYFAVPAAMKSRVRIATGATRGFDNTQKKIVPFTGFDFDAPEVDMHLIDHNATEFAMEVEGDRGSRVAVRASPEFRTWVVWTLKDHDYVCVEPWTSPGNALNTGTDLLEVQPGATRQLWIALVNEPA